MHETFGRHFEKMELSIFARSKGAQCANFAFCRGQPRNFARATGVVEDALAEFKAIGMSAGSDAGTLKIIPI